MTQQELKEYIIARVFPNNAQEITGASLQDALLAIVDNSQNEEEATEALARLATDISEIEDTVAQNTANIATKQKKLTLTVKDNGNIVIGNLDGQTKEFMPATLSGDPMHKMYEAVGAVYNSTDNDIAVPGIYGDTIIHKAGCWLLNEVGDLSNDDMAVIVSYPQYWSLTDMKIIAGYSPVRTTIPKRNWAELTGWYGGALNVQAQCAFFRATNLKTIAFFTGIDQGYKLRPSDLHNAFSGCQNLHKILNVINLANCTTLTYCFYNCTALEEVRIVNLKSSISFAESSQLSYESLRYMITECASSATFTITLHPTVKAKVQTGGEWNIGIEEALAIAREKGTTIDFGE